SSRGRRTAIQVVDVSVGAQRRRPGWLGWGLASRAMTNTDIVTSIDQRLVQAKAEIAQLESPRTALINGDAPTAPTVTRRARRPTRTATRRRTVRRDSEVVPAGKLTALLDGSAGMSTSELAKATRGKPDQILALLRELEKSEQIRRTGERRGTRCHLITDEDRVAARAAEIAAQSKRRPSKAS